jgi:hypothetical protein
LFPPLELYLSGSSGVPASKIIVWRSPRIAKRTAVKPKDLANPSVLEREEQIFPCRTVRVRTPGGLHFGEEHLPDAMPRIEISDLSTLPAVIYDATITTAEALLS